MRSFTYVFGVIAALLAPAALAAEFTAANGEKLPAPVLTSLDCPAMEQVLSQYMLSDYRGPEIVPHSHPDRKIYDYEDKLAEVFYQGCQRDQVHFQDASSAFSKGFK